MEVNRFGDGYVMVSGDKADKKYRLLGSIASTGTLTVDSITFDADTCVNTNSAESTQNTVSCLKALE